MDSRSIQKRIRNFCIIAHIDHGKSTLADRILEHTHTIADRKMTEQVLDSMDLEKERGITIKLTAVKIKYTAKDGNDYYLNLIDTPGHVDFSYEVSRSLAACEGTLLVVDASQGIEAQTMANYYFAIEHDLEIIPVINKIDLPAARPEEIMIEVEDALGLDATGCLPVSAKTGQGIVDVLEAIVERIPPPEGDVEEPLKALIFDSHFDPYKGVIVYVRVFDGQIKPGMKIKAMASEKIYEVSEVGVFGPAMVEAEKLSAGDVGFVAASIKDVKNARVGDTITGAENPVSKPLAGYKKATPMVFAGIYPVDNGDYEDLRDALEKLVLNDAALHFEAESSVALGFGFRCGFLGLLHMEIVQERLEREHELDIITTAPSVIYRITDANGNIMNIDNPADMPDPSEIEKMEEPFVKAQVIVPSDYVGDIMELCQSKRGIYISMEYAKGDRMKLIYELPLAEILMEFYDQLKSKSHGYAAFDYEYAVYKESKLVRLDILVAENSVDALSIIVHGDTAYERGRNLAKKLKKLIPKQLFEVPIQAAIGRKIIARETVKPLKKDVLAKCYGGDITRKRKLLEKQKEGKKRMKNLGNVEIPQEAFMAVLEIE